LCEPLIIYKNYHFEKQISLQMKKPSNSKKSPAKKTADKGKDSGELRKPTKLTPLKEKDKKNWKNNLDDEEEEDFAVEDDLKLDSNFDDEEEEDSFYDDDF
jgi:hypothetical protein